MRLYLFFFLLLITGNLNGQASVSKLLQSHSWIRCHHTLYVPDSLSPEKTEDCRDEFIFKKDGTIEYIDHARNYDPYDGNGCSNNFIGYSGKWSVWKGVVFITLNYETISDEKYIENKYRVKYISTTELHLVDIRSNKRK